MPEAIKRSGLVAVVHKLPIFIQRRLLGIGALQRSQTYITDLPGMIPMLDKNGKQTPELIEELNKRNIIGAESKFINMGGVLLHGLYLPSKNNKLVVAFHGIKGNWLNNPPAAVPNPKDSNYNPRYRMLLLEEFASNGFGFLAFTMPGFNPSQGTASEANFNKACEAFACFTINMALKNGIKPQDIIVCGESLGGFMAAKFSRIMTEKLYPPGVLSLIATFDSIIGMTHNEFPVFSEKDLSHILNEKLDTISEISSLDKEKTYLHIVQAENDSVIPAKNTLNLLKEAQNMGFNIVYHPTDGDHTTWDTGSVVGGKKLTHLAREHGVAIALHHSVEDIRMIIAQI